MGNPLTEKIEHEGDEFFDNTKVTTREDAAKIKEFQDNLTKQQREAARAKLQEAWMNQDNPALWDGEI